MESGISVICSTNKKGKMENILENFISQDYTLKELIIVFNYEESNLEKFNNTTLPYDNIQIYTLGSKKSLGECLNFCVEKSKYPIIAKFDDDDYYGPQYLSDSVKSLDLEGVGIVGKSCTFVYFVEEKLIAIQNYKKENKFVNRVAGSTLIFKKEIFNTIKFHDISLGEDIEFCKDCLNKGYKIYSTNKYHYVYIRNKKHNHTWKIDNSYILRQCKGLTKVENYKEYIENSTKGRGCFGETL